MGAKSRPQLRDGSGLELVESTVCASDRCCTAMRVAARVVAACVCGGGWEEGTRKREGTPIERGWATPMSEATTGLTLNTFCTVFLLSID